MARTTIPTPRCKHIHTNGTKCSAPRVTDFTCERHQPELQLACSRCKPVETPTATTVAVPENIRCTFDVSGPRSFRRSECRQDAVAFLVDKTWWLGEHRITHEPRCKRHAGVDKRRTYGSNTIVEPTHEIIAEVLARMVEREQAKAEERARKEEERERTRLAYQAERLEEAKLVYVVTRDDQKGDPDWDASRGATELVYGPSVPTWYVHPTGEEPAHGWRSTKVSIERKDGFPPTIELSVRSSLDVNAARALVEALQAAIEEA